MARVVGQTLPDEFVAIVNTERLEEHADETFVLASTDADDWPHIALLSVGEVVAGSSSVIRLALWHDSATTANLSRTGQGTLMWVGHDVWYVRLIAQRGLDIVHLSGSYAYFECQVAAVLLDTVKYAAISSAIRFTVDDVAGTMERWRSVRQLLRLAEPVRGVSQDR